MANSFEKLTPSEVTRIFSKMSPLKATRYYNKVMTNPSTPDVNVDLFRQYRAQNEKKFLTDEQMRSYGNKGSWTEGKGFGGGYRDRSYGRTYGSDGDSYDNSGRFYDRYGNERGGYNDGGYDRRPRVSRGGFSEYYGGGRKMRGEMRIDITQPRSYEQVGSRMREIDGPVGRTRYFMKVVNNSGSNKETITNLVKFRNANPSLFVSDEEAISAGPMRRKEGGFWASLWKSDAEFNAMSPKKKQFFVGAFKRKNRSKNTAYSLRVLTNPDTSREDKIAMVEVVNENPKLFFSKNSPSNGRKNN